MNDKLTVIGHITDCTGIQPADVQGGCAYQMVTPEKCQTNYFFNLLEIHSHGSVSMHSHSQAHVVYVLEGTCELLTDTIWHELQPGNYVYIHPQTIHALRNPNLETVKMIVLKHQ